MRPSQKRLFLSPFTDTQESDLIQEQLLLAACATHASIAYLCLHPRYEHKTLEFSYGLNYPSDSLLEVARFLVENNPGHLQEFSDLHQDNRFSNLSFIHVNPELEHLVAIPLHLEGELFGLLLLLDKKRQAFREHEIACVRATAKGILRIFEHRNTTMANELFRERVQEAEQLGGLGYWEMELEDSSLFWSEEVYRICGLDPDEFEVSPEAFYELVHPDDVEAIREQQAAITRRDREHMDIQHRINLPSGKTIWVHERGRLFRDVHGKPRVFKGTIQDITDSKERQEELERYTTFMESTLAKVPIGVCLYRMDNRKTTFSNDRLYEIIDWPRSSNPDGLTLMEHLYPDEELRKERLTLMEQSLRNPKLKIKDWEAQEITTSSGEKKLVNTRYVLLREHGLILLILSDVTEVYKTKEKLAYLNERYRLASLATSEVIWDSDLVMEEHYWGDNYKKVFGYTKVDDPVKNFHDWENHVHPADLQRVLEELNKATSSKKRIWQSEYRYKHAKTGEFRRVIDRGYIIRDNEGNATRMVGAMQDITEKYNKDERLRLFESAIENTRDGILITEADPGAPPQDHKIIYSNKAVQEMTGYSKKELLGMPPTLFRGPKTDFDSLGELDKEVHHTTSTIDVVNYKKSGEDFWINLSVTPVPDEKGEAVHFLSIQREINLKKAEEENRNLINRLAKDLSRQGSIHALMNRLCRSVGEILQAEVTEIWLLDDFQDHMNPHGFYARGEKYKSFQYRKNPDPKPGDAFGYHALVYKKRKRIAHRDITGESSPLRRKARAKEVGLQAAYGIPLMAGTKVVGVLMTYYRDSNKDFKKIMDRRLQDCDLFIGAELKRKQLNEQLGSVLTSVPDMICVVDKNGTLKLVNPGMRRLLGYTEKELIDSHVKNYVHPEDLYPSLRHLVRLAQGEQSPYFENRVRTKHGNFLWIAWTVNMEGNQDQFLAVGKNITENKKIISQIESSNQRFQMVSEAINDAIWEWNAKEDRLFWSDNYDKLFGYEPGDHYSYRDWMEKIHPEDYERVTAHIEEVFRDPSADTLLIDYRFRRADETYAYILDHSRIIRDKQGEIITVVGAMQDVTEKMKFERELVELNRELKLRNEQLVSSNTELEHFAYVASHDLQEPLRMISGFLTQLEKKYKYQLDEKGRTYIHYAVDGAKRMRTIIRELLEYSRVGRVSDNKEAVPVSDILDEVEVVYRLLLQQTGAKIIRPPQLPVIHSFRVLIFQLFQNLIDNALKYRKKSEAPRVEISYRELEEHWEFSVSDNGIGIDPDYFEKIFVIFQRLHQKDEYGGAGMGLTTAKKIVENLGGTITVDSVKDEGTTFTFTIRKEEEETTAG